MSRVFRPNAGRKEKLFTIFFVASLAAAIYGLSASVAPAGVIRENIGIISFALAMAYFLPIFFDRHPSSKVLGLPVLKRAGYYLGLLLISLGIAFCLAAYTLPIMFTSFLGKPYELSARVESTSLSAKGCRHRMKLEGIGYGINDTFCTDAASWERLKAGDRVRVYALKSTLGLEVKQVVIER